MSKLTLLILSPRILFKNKQHLKIQHSWQKPFHYCVSLLSEKKQFNLLSHEDREIIRRHNKALETRQSFYEDPKTGYIVWTAAYHLARGDCCGSACRHCPFDQAKVKNDKHKEHNGYFYKMMNGDRQSILVLYGSQTGTAQEVSERIVMQSRGSRFKCGCFALDEYNIENLVHAEVVIFVCSTTGQGEPPDNMKKFWNFIMRKNLPATCLNDVQYGVLGLGDSSYAKYNFVAKKLFRRLETLGAQPLLKLGLADDQHDWGADAVIDTWTTEMWHTLVNIYPVSFESTSPLGNSLPPPSFNVVECDSVDEATIKPCISTKDVKSSSYNRRNPFLAVLKKNERVTSQEHFQETRLLSFDVSPVTEQLTYEPGDVVMIQPSNRSCDVKEFVGALPFDPDLPVTFQPTEHCDFNLVIPQLTTLRELATNYFDFMSVPRRSFFQILSHFATDETEKEKLTEFGAPEGTEDRYDYANRPRRTILEVLQDFHLTSHLIPLERFFDVFPIIRPRAFSIASSPTRHHGEIHVLVAVVKYKTRLHRPRRGLCSTWMSHLEPGAKIPLWVKRGGIRFPKETPCIMVGPGTGIAPFRSSAHERSHDGAKETVVFFGCRSKDGDFYFQDEWKELRVDFHVAFSRDQDEKIYVQDKIRENAALMWDLIKHYNACIFIAGNSKNMPEGVKNAFLELFQTRGDMSSQEACCFYEDMQKSKRYQQETWS